MGQAVEGAAPVSVDDNGARAVSGVVRVVRMPFGVGVLAETPWAAFKGRDALKVDWDRKARGYGHDSDKAVAVYSAAARDLSLPGKPWDTAGDALAAMKGAATIYEAEYACDYTYHAQMEPLNSVASVSASGDACEIWCGTQSPSVLQLSVHAPAAHRNGAQLSTPCGRHVPCPSHVPGVLRRVPVHEAAMHTVSAAYLSQLPNPSHLPVVPQLGAKAA